MRFRLFVALVVAALVGSAVAQSSPVGANNDLRVTVARAPVAPDGTTAGAVTDFVVTFRDIDPNTSGIGIKEGGTIRVTLPPDFVNTGQEFLPAGSPCAAPPCNTAVILQGWPQSPQPPMPTVTWEAATNTVVLTAAHDLMPAGIAAPGPKQAHLILLGFLNPERPGTYRIGLSIQPDPDDPTTLDGTGNLRILRKSRASINPNSQANGAPPPPFANTLFQEIPAGSDSLTMRYYLWDRHGDPIVGATVNMLDLRRGDLLDADGKKIGHVRLNYPFRSDDHQLVTTTSVEGPAFVTGIPTGVMEAVLQTDADVTGWYRVTFRLFGGNTLRHRIITS